MQGPEGALGRSGRWDAPRRRCVKVHVALHQRAPRDRHGCPQGGRKAVAAHARAGDGRVRTGRAAASDRDEAARSSSRCRNVRVPRQVRQHRRCPREQRQQRGHDVGGVPVEVDSAGGEGVSGLLQQRRAPLLRLRE